MKNTDVSFVLGSLNRKNFLIKSIDSIRKELNTVSGEIIVIDGGSSDGSIEWLAEQKDIITIVQHNRGLWNGKEIERRSWGYFMNLGFKIARGKYICMLSDDCLLIPDSIGSGIKQFKKYKNVGAVAFYWRNWPIQKKYWVGTTLGGKLFVNHGLYLKEALEKVGFLDEDTYNFYHGDGDICLKLWEHGYKVVDSKLSFVEHFFHANHKLRKSNNKRQNEDWDKYLKKWKGKYYKIGDSTGGWKEISFSDKNKTANMFFDALGFSDYINIIISRWVYPFYLKYLKR